MKRLFVLLSLYCTTIGFVSLPAQCPNLFADGWESGTWSPTWTAISNSYTRSVVTTNPAVGTYCFSQSGFSSHYMGTTTTFGTSTPPNLGIWVKSSAIAGNNSAYVVIGDGNISLNHGIIFFYFDYTGVGRLFTAGSGPSYSFPASDNTWYHLEFENIDYVNATYDFYLNGVLAVSGMPFRSQFSSNIDRIHLYNFSGTATAYYDDFVVGSSTLNLNTTATDASCGGGSNGTAMVTSNGAGPFNYSWSNNGNTQMINNLLPGSYQVTVTDSNGCSGNGSTVVSAPSAMASSVLPLDLLCDGDSTGSIDLTPSGGVGGYSYLWSNSAVVEDPTGLTAGSYSVVITDSNGCTHTDTATISSPPAISSTTLPSNLLCNGFNNGSIDLTPSGGVGGYSYLWSNGNLTQDPIGLVAGTYSVTITDSNGCTHTDMANITGPPALGSSVLASNILCNGDSTGAIDLTPSGGVGGYNFLWSNGSVAEDPSGLPAGSYSVVITDSAGCIRTAMATIVEPTAVVLNPMVTNVSCNGANDGSATLSVSGGTPGYTYSWSNGSTSTSAINLLSGSYSVVVTDNNGCTTIDSLTITEPTQITASGTVIDDNGSTSGAIDITMSGGTPGYTFSWTGPGGFTASTEDLSNLGAGTYVLTVTDLNGCVYTETFVVSLVIGVNPQLNGPEISVAPNPTSGLVRVSVTLNELSEVAFALTDLRGRVIYEASSPVNGLQLKRDIDLSSLAAGVYMLKVAAGDAVSWSRVVKN